MDLAQTLIRSVMRAFYETKYVLAIDALVIHSALNDSDLALLLNINTKELHKICGKLKEDRFLAVHTRPELKEGQLRPVNKIYYYLDYRSTIDAIKWRMYSIDKLVQGTTVKAEDRKEFVCPRCSAQWTLLQVLNHNSPEGFLCERCRGILKRNDESTRGGHEQSTKLNAQFRFITDLLPRIDQVVVPENTFETAMAAARPVVRDATLQYQAASVPVDASSRPAAVRGLTDTGPTSISVTVTATDAPTLEEQELARIRKGALAAQNALPQHFTHSTVTNERIIVDGGEAFAVSGLDSDRIDMSMAAPEEGKDISAISDDYFEQLKRDQAREALEALASEDEDDEDEEDVGFEDGLLASAGAASVSATGTPVGSTGVDSSTTRAPGALASALKRSGSGTSSGISTGVASPAGEGQTPEGARAAKKVRIEEPPATAQADVESEEDEMEFEDV